MTRRDPLFALVESFFHDYLQRARGASRHTVLAYADALRLFFGFVADSAGKAAAGLRTDDVTAENVLAFLDHLDSCGRKVSTRNLRLTALRSLCRHLLRQDPTHAGQCLAALHSFARHVLRNDPTRAEQYQRLLSLPFKKTGKPVVSYVEPDEMRLVLEQVNRRSRRGPRDYALLLFLYNSIATGPRGSRFHRRHRDPGTHLGRAGGFGKLATLTGLR